MQQDSPSNPLVSIIVRTKDRLNLLKRALTSLANVTYQDKEIIIINDGGCDVNKEDISNTLRDVRFEIYVNKTSLGRAEALNKGIANAKGELICFLDDDDVIIPDGTAELVKAFNGVYNKIIYGNVVCRRYEEDSFNLINEWVLDNPYDKERLVLENYIPINSLCIPKKFLLQIGPLDPSFLIYEDWDMLLRLSDITHFIHIDKTIAEYSIFGISTITGKEGVEFQKHYRQKILTKHFNKVSPSMILRYIFFAPHVLSKDYEIEQLMKSIKDLNAKLNHFQDEIRFYKDQINFYKNLTEKINRLEEENAELNEKIERLEHDNSKHIETITAIKNHNIYLSAELNKLTQSRSWRMTKPIRELMQRIRRSLGIFKNSANAYKPPISLDSHRCQEIVDRARQKVEIIIVNYNGLEHLKRCIPSVLNTNYPFFTVTIVDNNSSDGSIEYIQRNFPQIKVIRNSSNLGFALANDIAIEQSDANLIALLNNDTEVEPNWLTYLVAYLLVDEGIAATSSKLLLMNHRSVINNGGSSMSLLGFGYDKGMYLPDGKSFSETKGILFPSGASCLMRRDIYIKVGGFDTSYFMYHEDVDLGWRFWIYGYRVLFVPKSRVYHAFGGTSHKIGGHSFREIYGLQHALRALIKNYQIPTLTKTLPMFILLCLKKYPSSFMKVIGWNLKMLPSTVKERRRVNKYRQNSDDFFFQNGLIETTIYPNIYHPDYEILDLQTFIKSENTRDFILMAVTDDCNLGYGWYRKEIWHKDGQTKIRCTMSEAVVFLFSESHNGYVIFEIASIAAAIGLTQSFSVFINDKQIDEFVIKDDNLNTFEVPYKGIYGPLEIRLKVNNTFIPNNYFNNSDEREIGLVVKSIRLKPINQNKVIHGAISVIIPTYNRANELMRTLAALERQSLEKDKFEVIIVDDGSTDNTAEKVREFIGNTSLDIKYFYQDNKKPAAARNLGIKMSKNDLIVFLGDDTTPDRDFLKVHLDTHRTKNIDGKLAVLGYTSWPEEYRVSPFLRFINGYGSQFGYDLIKDGDIVNYSLFYTSNISLSRSLLNRLDHFFDEDFKIAGWEDTDIGYRLQKKGMSILYNPQAKTNHYHKINIVSFCRRQFNVGKFAKIMYDKHPELYEFLNLKRASTLSKHIPMAIFIKYIISILDYFNIPLPHRLYDYVLKVYYLKGYSHSCQRASKDCQKTL